MRRSGARGSCLNRAGAAIRRVTNFRGLRGMSSESAAPLVIGDPAPDFTLNTAPDQTLSLSELRGRPVVLVFYPADWSPVCGDQVALYNELLGEFGEYNAHIIGLS